MRERTERVPVEIAADSGLSTAEREQAIELLRRIEATLSAPAN